MENRTIRVIAALVVAAVWGYFADLKNDQIGWFIGRLIFLPLFVEIFFFLIAKRKRNCR